MIKVNEIFLSLQGESTYAGLPCIFVRLTGCNLRCKWCDTTYSFYEGTDLETEAIIERISKYDCKLIEFTGGEPLLQKNELLPIFRKLIDNGFRILLETNGSISLKEVPKEVVKIVDYKTLSSGENKSFNLENIQYLDSKDEVKFVINDNKDFLDVVNFVKIHDLKAKLLISKVGDSKLTHREIADLILSSGINFRYQIQMHKIIWGNEKGR
ncbi:MAG: radical SAM protein [Candidatus Delongbacteria bacterium]|nr:radical SAM protein [Candidatus Delongbacteria bacterium]MBN2835199.1 radical SAM protein [Candidatus Delongbacteria bacterium]